MVGTKVANAGSSSLFSGQTGLDPGLTSLFSTSSGPVRAVEKGPDSQLARSDRPRSSRPKGESDVKAASTQEISSSSSSSPSSPSLDIEGQEDSEVDVEANNEVDRELFVSEESQTRSHDQKEKNEKKKRKRVEDDQDANLEALYLEKLAREEEKEHTRAKKRRINDSKEHEGSISDKSGTGVGDGDQKEGTEIDSDTSRSSGSEKDMTEDAVPQHETKTTANQESELDKASRTVFLGNVSTTAITSKSDYRSLKTHLSSFFPLLEAKNNKAKKEDAKSSEGQPPPKIESLRFRSTPYASTHPKKAAFAKRELLDATTKSTNAYAVYSTRQCALLAATKLNGTVVLNRHLRVDSVAHPSKTDHKRCVFVGNLGFVDDESLMHETEEAEGHRKPERNKKSRVGDTEEGLWRQFGKAGTVESVRVVRDPKTRVSKGIAYVQFTDQNGVEAALRFDGNKFPPLLPRRLRVARCKKNTASSFPEPVERPDDRALPRKKSAGKRAGGDSDTTTDPTLRGRAKKLLGRAGASQMRDSATNDDDTAAPAVFEGHRATSAERNAGLKLGGKSKKGTKSGKKSVYAKGKGSQPKGKRAKRALAWKSGGVKQVKAGGKK
ncbi:MAG: Nucleolar protein 12 [Alyxoria varia]|nr:MAG: Nucleolar protein 12 [Alyxoria varia]